MKLIPDNNIFFSLMKPSSINSYLFSMPNVIFFAPAFLKSEFEKHKSECLSKSKLSEHEFEIRQTEVEKKIEFIPISEYKRFLDEAKSISPDPDDVEYLALALKLNSAVWSNDKLLKKQSKVKVFSTSELIKKLGL